MKLHVIDEFSPLKKVAVCYGTSIPTAEEYHSDDPQEQKWDWKGWDKELLLKQQEVFFQKMDAYGVELLVLETEPEMLWQMYTRDTGFVLGDRLYYAEQRTLKARRGEIGKLLAKLSLDAQHHLALGGKIEGGDVLASATSLVGISNRTDQIAATQLSTYQPIQTLLVGDDVMHLDTRLTLLPNNYALAYMSAFTDQDQSDLASRYKIITVTQEEVLGLGTNVFVINPETIFVEEKQQRIKNLLVKAGFRVESIAYSEPIALGGSFRCTTLPLVRE